MLSAVAIQYEWIHGPLASPEFVAECSVLYSRHYGKWSECSPTAPGENVRLSSSRIRDLLVDGSVIAFARLDDELIGYAIAVQNKSVRGTISWVTQLVVHKDYRNRNIGKSLLFSIWTFSNHYAWGLITASPFAIRALEKATRRRCDPLKIQRNQTLLYNHGCRHIDYVESSDQPIISENGSKINTHFFVDHSDVPQMVKSVESAKTPWVLGEIEEGYEWFAFTFQDQPQIQLSSDEIAGMVDAS
ncbi:GNAT family N-acetyltransferase, partial [bacterium]|nr:GNAT family N-acetyltransferase [bacterium]